MAATLANDDSTLQPPDDSPYDDAAPTVTHKRTSDKLEREKRTYRACLHCRQRKSRCDLYGSGEPGRPPCERCIREQHECTLGGSRRGGRRVKQSQSDLSIAAPPQPPSIDNVMRSIPIQTPFHGQQSPPTVGGARQQFWSGFTPETRLTTLEPPVQVRTRSNKMTMDDQVASTDLQNPADALEFLAHVAERDSGREAAQHQLPPMQSSVYGLAPQRTPSSSTGLHGTPCLRNQGSSLSVIDYPPLSRGQLDVETIHALLLRYEEKYHPFFPIANPMAVEPQHLRTIAAKEPHLLSAILAVASKDEKEWWQVHEACSAHMQQLISSLVYGGGGTVEAVEALLILAEWVPRRPQSAPAIGRGEEDAVAWMLVGTAIRLGYLLGIDRTGFRTESDHESADLNRKRLAWASCYMSDRQISVRVGKAFWSRGPGPMTALRAADFPSLQPKPNRQDDLAAIFQANLELTQLFSNAHDILYATKIRSNQLNYGGEYVKYIDDFRVSLRNWDTAWGVVTCSPPLKASLILSYQYLRLYINAFAYQATLNRLVAQVQAASTNGQQAKSPAFPFADIAATPDARFIYDSIDAAKSLLSTFNSFVDPVETFRFMPLRYYLYVIYSACFLYKARSTGVMGGDTRGSIKRLISDTVQQLAKASACSNDVGDRYSRLIRLLWRKPPGRGSIAESAEITRPPTALPPGPSLGNDTEQLDQTMYDGPANNINAFSWLDLGAVGDFATNNNSISGSLLDGLDRFEDGSVDGFSTGLEPNIMMPQPYAWNASPSGIVF